MFEAGGQDAQGCCHESDFEASCAFDEPENEGGDGQKQSIRWVSALLFVLPPHDVGDGWVEKRVQLSHHMWGF